MVRAGTQRGKIRAAFFWAIILLVQVTALAIGIGYMSYWTIPPFRVHVEGDPFFSYDPEVGYVARPNSSARWTAFGADGKISLQFQVHTDGRGARVANRGEQNPKPVDIVFVGDSFTWGYGVEGHETFALKTITALGGTGANLAVAGYGTTHSLQLLRRNRDLAPKLVIYPLLRDHLWRNVSSCARSAYPFCLDYSHVAWNEKGQPYVALPRTDGVARVHRQMRAEQGGLDPVTWIIHGLDVIVARLRFRAADANASDREKQDAALAFLIREMASTASEMKAALLIVYLPDQSMSPSPEMLSQSAQKLGYRFLELSESFMKVGVAARSRLSLPNDGHPSAAGHALIAEELIAYIRREHLLAR
jgi:lysophospholipase L1-like esterase